MEPYDLELKPLSEAGIDAALKLADHYRLLNEPYQAESICRDVLRVDPANQQALRELILALTDRFEHPPRSAPKAALALLSQLTSEYDQLYYEGIVHERAARAGLRQGIPRCGEVAYEGFRRAMASYEAADALTPAGDDKAHLRWNTCARTLRDHPGIRPAPTDTFTPMLE